MVQRNSFEARTRLRNGVDYWRAVWKRAKPTDSWMIRFVEGPYRGKLLPFHEAAVEIAPDDKHFLEVEDL